MIGFTVTVESNIGYSSSEYTSWTEGDLFLAEKAMSKFAVKGTALFMPDLLGAIESKFGVIKKVLLEKVAGIGNPFAVGIYGSVFLFINFNPNDGPEITVWRLLDRIDRSNVKLGDQVMIQICKHIALFDEHITLYGTGGELAPTMAMTLNL